MRVGGGERTVRFGLLALKRLEDAFGSLAAAERRIVALRAASATGAFGSPLVGDLGLLLAAATGLDADVVLDGFERRLGDAIEAIWVAWEQAWPAPTEVDEGKAPGDDPSPGGSSTTGPPSGGVAPTSSSGG